MEKLTIGEVAKLENNQEYIVAAQFNKDGKDYVFLMSSKKPIDFKFASQEVDPEGALRVNFVGDKAKKRELLNYYQQWAKESQTKEGTVK